MDKPVRMHHGCKPFQDETVINNMPGPDPGNTNGINPGIENSRAGFPVERPQGKIMRRDNSITAKQQIS